MSHGSSLASNQLGVLLVGASNDIASIQKFDRCVHAIVRLAECDLRLPIEWRVSLWQVGVHRALVFKPDPPLFQTNQAHASFEMTVTDEVLYTRYREEVAGPETKVADWAIVIDISVDNALFFLDVGVIVFSIDGETGTFTDLGLSQQVPLCGSDETASIAGHSKDVILGYRRYSVFGTNCQHFARDLAAKVGISSPSLRPADEDAVFVGSVFGGIAGGGVAATATVTAPAWGPLGWFGVTTTAPMFSTPMAVAIGVGFAASVIGSYVFGQNTQREAVLLDQSPQHEGENPTPNETYHLLYIDGFWQSTGSWLCRAHASEHEANLDFDSTPHSRVLVRSARHPQQVSWYRVGLPENRWHQDPLVAWATRLFGTEPEGSFEDVVETM